MPPKEKYTDPKLRDEVKEDIQNSDKGGAPGQWSARKAQFMASEYKKRGGDYNTDKKDQDDSQKNLSKWSEEEWQTKEGSGNAKQEDGTQKRYLPKKAWEQMSDKEKEETEEKKIEGGKEGKQFVGNTGKAKGARENANEKEHKAYEEKKRKEKGEDGDEEADEQEEDDADEVEDEAGEEDEEYEDGADEDGEDDLDGEEDDAADEGDDDDAVVEKDQKKPSTRGQKRGKSTNGTGGSNKKQKSSSGSAAKPKSQSNGDGDSSKKTVGSKHQPADAPAPQASVDRLPKKGQSVTWKALPGWVEGEVIEVVYEDKTIEGKSTKASKDDPRIFMRSKNGKVAVHKPTAVYFD